MNLHIGEFTPSVPGVPAVAGWAPGSTRQPPGLECLAATAAAMVELHTDCFHIMSQFCAIKSVVIVVMLW